MVTGVTLVTKEYFYGERRMSRCEGSGIRFTNENGRGPRDPPHPQVESVPPRAQYRVRAKVWLYPGAGGWHFVNLSRKQSREIRQLFGTARRGWGAVPVTVVIGKTTWSTSLFPEKKTDSYVFAIKAEVRRSEGIEE